MEKEVSYNFTHATPRQESNAEKYTLRKKLFGTEDVLPAWVADMDIETPPFVIEAIQQRLQHPIMGYEDVPSSAYEAQIAWVKKRHGVDFELDAMLHSHSVVASMSVAIEAFTNEGDGVIVQTPVYSPFFHSVLEHKRELVKNSLMQDEDGIYHFDIEDLKAKITPRTKLLLLCSPHNPVGRVWKREELEQILEVCLEHNIVVFADEIHSDLVYAPNKHTPFCSLSAQAKEISITAMGVGKTFNMAGLAMSSAYIPNKELRERFLAVYKKNHFAQGNILSHVAFEAAYREGETWLEELLEHLQSNYKELEKLCACYPEQIKLTPIEGTYLAWLDCRAMGLKDRELREFFVQEAKLGLNAGISFGREGSGFMRLNFAVPSDIMSRIVSQLQNALEMRAGNPQ